MNPPANRAGHAGPRRILAGLTLCAIAATSIPALAAPPNVEGAWTDVAAWPRIPIHAALLPDGKVVTFGATPQGNQGGLDVDIWDPKLGLGNDAHVTLPNGIDVDSFCAAQILESWNGNIMMVGGSTNAGDDNTLKTAQFSFKTRALTRLEGVKYPRWYSTTTTVPDGRIVVHGGVVPYADWNSASMTPEIYTPGQGWRELAGAYYPREQAGDWERRYWFPRSWAAPGNKLFVLTGKTMYQIGYDGNGSIGNFQPFNKPNWGSTGSAVLYAPKKVLQVGGGAGGNDDPAPAGSKGATTIDFSSFPYKVADTAPMTYGRHWPTATVLPTGDVLVTGGAEGNNGYNYRPETAAYAAEIWNPATGRWRVGASMKIPRLYHSTALLLPDGRVLSGGGGAPGPVYGNNVEVYSPPYLFADNGQAAARPVIASEPGIVRLGQKITVKASGPRPITRFTMVKTGAVTHGYNTDQRFLELPFTKNGDAFDMTITADATDATPGYYMLFALDDRGTPSLAKMMRIPSPTADNGDVPPTSGTPVADNGGNTGGGNTGTGGTGTGTGTGVPAQPGNVLTATPTKQWAAIGQTASKVAAAADGTTAVVNRDTNIVWLYRNADDWTALQGQKMKEIAVGGANRIVGIGLDNVIYRWNGTAWVRIGGWGRNVSAASDGTVVVTNDLNEIWLKQGDDFNDAWQKLPGTAQKVSAIAAGRFWSVGTDGNVYRYTAAAGWTQAGVAVSDIAVSSDGSIAVVNKPAQTIWRKANDDAVANWVQTDGKALQIAAPNATWVIAIGTDNAVYRFSPTGTAPTSNPTPTVTAGALPLTQASAVLANHSKLCLSVVGNATNDGAGIVQDTCRGVAAQNWQLVAQGAGYLVKNAASNKCLDVYGGGMGDGTRVVQWPCHGNANQIWKLQQTAAGTSLVALHSNKCLDVAGISNAAGAQVWQWTCNNQANQAWSGSTTPVAVSN